MSRLRRRVPAGGAERGPRSWPLSLAAGWAQLLASWDCARGRSASRAAPSRLQGAPRRLRRGVTGWNGGLGLAWLALAVWRTAGSGSWPFAVVMLLALVNLAVVGRLSLAEGPGTALTAHAS